MKTYAFLSSLLIAAAIAAPAASASSWDDEDDIYYNPSQQSRQQQQLQTNYVPNTVIDYPAATTYVATGGGLQMSVDDYNRRGQFLVPDTVISSDSTELGGDSYQYTRRIERFYNSDIVSGSGNQALVDSYYSTEANSGADQINVYVINDYPSWGYSWAYPYSYYMWTNPYYYGWSYAYPYYGWSWSWGFYDPYYTWSWGWSPCYPYYHHYHHWHDCYHYTDYHHHGGGHLGRCDSSGSG